VRSPSRASLVVVLLGLAALLLAACGAQTPSATNDAQALFIRAVDRMLALQSIRVHGTLDPASNLLGGPDSATFDADIDAGNTAAHIEGRSSEAAAKPFRLVVKDGVWWIDTGAGFQKQGGGMLPLPAGDDLRSAITNFASDARLQVTNEDVACAGRTCHRLTAVVPPEVVWERFAPVAKAVLPLPDAPPAGLPTAQVILDVDAETFDPYRADVQVTLSGAPVHLVLEGSLHDQPLTIEPPAG
jgi:hypothetical protein